LRFAAARGIELVFSPLRAHRDARPGQPHFHVIEHGFALREAALDDWLSGASAAAFAKYVLRLAFDESVDDAVAFARAKFEKFGKRAVIQLRLAANNPAQVVDDEVWLCRRLAAAVVLGHATRGVEITCDAFTDAERGYFPHAGVVDRRYNPRPALRVIRHLHGLLARIPEGRAVARVEAAGARVFELPAPSPALICLPDGALRLRQFCASATSLRALMRRGGNSPTSRPARWLISPRDSMPIRAGKLTCRLRCSRIRPRAATPRWLKSPSPVPPSAPPSPVPGRRRCLGSFGSWR